MLLEQTVAGEENHTYVVEVLAHLLKESIVSSNVAEIKPCPPEGNGEMHVRNFSCTCHAITYLQGLCF